ncbi:MAG: hypothetical protein QXQ79_02710 [Candidatus Nanoarchaeia archaeon]
MPNGEKFGPTPEEIGISPEIIEKEKDDIKVEYLDTKIAEDESSTKIMERLNNLLKKPTAKIGMALMTGVLILGLAARKAEAKEEKIVARVVEKTEVKKSDLDKELALQEMVINIQNEGYLKNVDLVDYSIDVNAEKVCIEGRVIGDLEGLKEIIKIDKESPFYPDYQKTLNEIKKNYESKFPNLGQRRAVAERASGVLAQKLLLETLVFVKTYYEAEKNPNDKNLQQQKQVIQSQLSKTMIGLAANNELAK